MPSVPKKFTIGTASDPTDAQDRNDANGDKRCSKHERRRPKLYAMHAKSKVWLARLCAGVEGVHNNLINVL
jgi:hypothetical protein